MFGAICHVRLLVLVASAVLAVAGWMGAGLIWLLVGHEAGVHPAFIMALTFAGTFSLTFAVSVVMPDTVRAYGLGHRDGYAAAMARREAPSGQRAPLSLVRH